MFGFVSTCTRASKPNWPLMYLSGNIYDSRVVFPTPAPMPTPPPINTASECLNLITTKLGTQARLLTGRKNGRNLQVFTIAKGLNTLMTAVLLGLKRRNLNYWYDRVVPNLIDMYLFYINYLGYTTIYWQEYWQENHASGNLFGRLTSGSRHNHDIPKVRKS